MRLALVMAAAACSPAAIPPLPPNAFAFGVFGDGLYTRQEEQRFKRLLRDVNGGNLQWLIHIGDIQGHPCANEILADRHRMLQTIETAVIYTPGDNEWTDCHRDTGGGFDPLERLQNIRKTLFATPHSTLGRRPITVETQSDDNTWAEFVENIRWRYGGFLFVTAHVVGSANGKGFEGESPAERTAEADRRMAAALHWLDTSFAIARNDSLHGLVIAVHADPGFERPEGSWPAYREFVRRLRARAGEFPGFVLFVHGDSHVYRVDNPLMRPGSDTILANFTRLETYGSQDIGWVRVVVDSVAGRVISYEPRLMRQRQLW
ncbi:MAG: hypothetical protein ACT4P6_13465 [Gemmatimonadaceae bacterium]